MVVEVRFKVLVIRSIGNGVNGQGALGWQGGMCDRFRVVLSADVSLSEIIKVASLKY